jgi:hypothetical protein
MGSITIAEICDAVADTIGSTTGINRVQHYDELGEGLMDADLPLLQVFFDSFNMSTPGDTDRNTMGRGVALQRITLFADIFCAQRHNTWQDVELTTRMASSALDKLESLYHTRPYFGLEGIKAWQLSQAQRGTITYGQVEYMTVRFTINVVVY